MPVSRNVETQGLWIQRWITGLVTQRSPLYTPISALGLQVVSRQDALIDGLNTEISPIMTVIRRPAYTRFNSVAYGATEYPLNYFSFQNTSGTIYPTVDTTTNVRFFSPGGFIWSLPKSAGAGRGDFVRIGDNLYYCNGADTKFWPGIISGFAQNFSNWGIAAPTAVPTLATPASGTLSPQSGYQYVYCYVNTITGHVSAASPISANTGPLTSKSIDVTFTASTDPQVNAVWIFRILDGGGIFYFVTSVPNISSTYRDSTADSGLVTGIVAPFAPNNAPCPAGASLTTYWDGRPWVAAKNFLYWAMGPQATTGLGEQAFNLTTNFFKLPINITGFAPTTNGLLVFTTDTIWIVTGTGGVYFINPWQKNLGIKQPNAVAQDGDLVFFFTSRGQLFELGTQLNEIGQNIRRKIAAMNPNTVSIDIHRNGEDEGLFLSDNVSSVYRYSLVFQCWMPPGRPVGQGAGVVKSIETSDSIWTLMLGTNVGGQFDNARNVNSWTDQGGTYTAYATVGSIIVGPPGSKNLVESISIDATKIGTYPQVSILTNEIAGAFALLPNPVPDPPTLPENQTLYSRRHYLKYGTYPVGTPIPQQIEHCQIKVSFFAENFPSELLTMGIQ